MVHSLRGVRAARDGLHESSPGHSGGPGGAALGRLGRGCRRGRQRLPGTDGAHRLWHRRRFVCAGVGSGQPTAARAHASGRSPGGLTLEYLQQQGLKFIPSYGPLPVTVPGCVDGWFTLHARFGRQPMASNLAPAIAYGREGFPVSEVIAKDWAYNLEKIGSYPNVKELYAPGGSAPRAGQRFRNPALAETYAQIAAGGRDAFYRGDLARTISAFHRQQGGFLSEQDFAEHTSTWVEPVSTTYRGYEVWELPPNGQGIAVLQMLNLLEGFDLASFGFGSAAYLHTLVEAKKLAFADRARLYADPDFFQTPVNELLSKDYAARRRALIDPERTASRHDPGIPALRTSDTIYLCVADEQGMMVSLIQSNYRGMGSGMVPPGLGFSLQDRGEAFDLTPGRPNTYAPRKRPFHTIIPAFVTVGGEPLLAFGVMGGDMQPQAHVQVLVNLIDFGMGLQEAGDAPRAYHTGSSDPNGLEMKEGGTLSLEGGFASTTWDELARRGHRFGKVSAGSFGGYQAVMWDRTNRVWIGASESRKDGHAAGY